MRYPVSSCLRACAFGLLLVFGPSGPARAAEIGNGSPKESFDLAARKELLPWIWQVPARQPVPVPPPGSNPSSDIDRFLLATLHARGIEPAPSTDDRTWLRRVHFTLIGLPPSPEAAHAFAADPSPDKRERVVHALLSSSQYGEHWARHWMDLVRYAESRGHESDFLIPNAWQYRDYLVRAFNADVPYDRFMSEHVAGDLLPPRRNPETGIDDAVLATGWAFLGEEVHSPVDIRQDECERVDNKVDVLSKTFLGLTVACARCHDHKFDAISQRDYYALAGFVLGSSYRQVRFETAEEHAATGLELETLRDRHRPAIAAAVADAIQPSLSDVAGLVVAAHHAAMSSATEPAPTSTIPQARLAAWLAHFRAATNRPAHPLHLLSRMVLSRDALELAPPRFSNRIADLNKPSVALPEGARVIADFTLPGRTPWKTDGPVFGRSPRTVGEIILGNSATNPVARVLPYGAARRDHFWNRLALEPGNESEAGSLNATGQAGRMLRTPTFTLDSGKLHYLVRGRTRVYAAVDSHIMLAGPLHGILVASFDGGPEADWVTHDLAAYSGHRAHLEFVPEGEGDLEILVVVEAPEKPSRPAVSPWLPQRNPGSLRELAEAFQSDLTAAARRLAANDLSREPALASLADWMVRNPALFPAATSNAVPGTGVARAMADFLRDQDAIARRTRWTSRTAVAWFDGTGVDEHVLTRGKPSRPAGLAPRALPSVLGTSVIGAADSSGRAELARQLADPANPLVARVIVNRAWQHVFGRGIVGTPDNFGYLGERPTHPELLDQLAWQFVHEDHWSLKGLLKRLVLTDAFARSSRAATGPAAELDPNNTLLHRMPVRRLEAEAIRDAVLAVSGRLDLRIGGPPVPVHLTEFIIGRGRPDRSGPLDGEGRRSIYIAVPRNFLPTMMVAFDFPTPFSTVGRRNTTNVPGQPLTLMNDPFLHDQAGFWARRVLRTLPGATDDARIRWMFETAFARPPAEPELRACSESLAEIRSLHSTGQEPAAWSDFAHALLNANEFIYLN